MRRCVTPLRPLLVGLVIGWLAVPPVARAVESTFVTIVGPSGNSADVSAGRRLLVDTGESQPFQLAWSSRIATTRRWLTSTCGW